MNPEHVSPDLKEAEAWQPRPTEGPVPRRVEKYKFSPLFLPTTPAYAKDPRILSLAAQLMTDIKQDTKAALPDPWARTALWLQHPYYSIGHKVRLAFPGFGIAVVAFAAFLGLEYVGVIPKKQHGEHRH